MSEFQSKLRELINYHSLERHSDTPDFLLAEYLADCLGTWNKIVQKREDWYGRPLADPEDLGQIKP